MSLEPERILVIRRKAIGDMIVSVAVLRELCARWPKARLDLVVDHFVAPVVRDSPHVDRVLVYDRRHTAEGPPWSRAQAAIQWMRLLRGARYDLVLDLMGTPQTAMWTWMTGARHRVGRKRRGRAWAYDIHLPPRGDARFAGEVFLDWVRVLGAEPEPWRPEPVARPEEVDAEAEADLAGWRRPGRPLVVLNASATWPAKAWPLPHFARLARRLREEVDADVLLAWGPGEEGARDTIQRLAEGSLRVMPPTDLRALAAWLSRADLLITTDSGPKHLAVGEGTPTLTLFGSTNPKGWQPADPRHRWLTHDVPCHPCDRLECPVAGHPCLDDLRPERVATEAIQMLRARREASA